MSEQTFLTTDDLAARWHIKAPAVCRLIRAGKLRATFIGGQWLVRPADVETFERTQANVQAAQKRTRRPRARRAA